MTLFDMPNYLWITTLIMILLTIFCCLVLNKWFVSAVITFVILGVLAFFIPNFQDIKYQPLLGYAAFLAIMSLLISFLLWYFTRNWRKERKARKLEKQIENTAMRALNFAVKIKNNIRQLYAQNHRLLSYTAVTIISKEMEYSAIVVFVLTFIFYMVDLIQNIIFYNDFVKKLNILQFLYG